MVSSFTRLAAFLGALSAVQFSVSSPLAGTPVDASITSRSVSRRAVPAAPHWVVYQDAWVSGETGPPDVSVISGYNTFAMSFLLSSGAADQAIEWADLTADQRTTIKTAYAAAGISLVVSAFGSTEQPTTSGLDATTVANSMGQWVLDYDLDGIDVDYEDLTAFDEGTGGEDWLITFTTQIRTLLPQGTYIVTHAPLAPWFSPTYWTGGGFLKVHESVGSLVDWYNVQFYNQGVTEYTTCDGLLTASSATWPETSLFEIIANGVDADKLVIGKPATTADASNGYMDPATLATCVSTAVGQGWDAGVMAWQYPSATSAWITTVRGATFPVAALGGATPVNSTAPTSTGPVNPPFPTLTGAVAALPITKTSVSTTLVSPSATLTVN